MLYASGITHGCLTWVWSTVFVFRPTNRMSTAQVYFKVVAGAGTQSTRVRYLEKYLEPCRPPPAKEWCLWRQAINLTPPKRLKAWRTAPEARGITSAAAHPTGTSQLTTRPAEVRQTTGEVQQTRRSGELSITRPTERTNLAHISF